MSPSECIFNPQQQNPQSVLGSIQVIVLASIEVIKMPETSSAMVISNMQGILNGPQSAGDVSGRPHQVVSAGVTPAAQPNVSSVPLFDESQIIREVSC